MHQGRLSAREYAPVKPDIHPKGGPVVLWQTPKLRFFLPATTLIYTVGAGMTAAAGTRLAFQSVLIEGFITYSFQLQDIDAQHWYSLSVLLCVNIGQFARLLPSLDVVTVCLKCDVATQTSPSPRRKREATAQGFPGGGLPAGIAARENYLPMRQPTAGRINQVRTLLQPVPKFSH